MSQSHPIFLVDGGMKCPRPSCRYEQPGAVFDSLSSSKEPECQPYLLVVWKCPQCKHLFSALTTAQREAVEAAGPTR